MRTPIELREQGFKALIETLGCADAIRFLKQFDNGNYTRDRHQWLDSLILEDILSDIQQRQMRERRGD